MHKSFSFLLLSLALFAWASPALAQSVTGPVRVVDGDTLVMRGERIRIHGIDAPEARQSCDNGRWACGQASTDMMTRLVANQPVTCQGRDRDPYGRLVAVCFNHQGLDVGRELVRAGLATAYRRFSSDYVNDEDSAKAQGAGMWSGEFSNPAQHRQGNPQGSTGGGFARPIEPSDTLSGLAVNSVRAVAGFAGRVIGEVARSSASGGAASGRGGYADFHDYNSDGIVDGGPSSRRSSSHPSALTPPSQGMAPPGAQGAGGLSADQVCALAAMLDRPC